MDVQAKVLAILQESLGLRGDLAMTKGSPLLGAVPELDSMTIVTLITTLEERFGFGIADDEISAATFSTLGALTDFVEAKLKGDAPESD